MRVRSHRGRKNGFMWDCGSGEVWARRGKEVFLWGCGGREGWGRMVESKESWVKKSGFMAGRGCGEELGRTG